MPIIHTKDRQGINKNGVEKNKLVLCRCSDSATKHCQPKFQIFSANKLGQKWVEYMLPKINILWLCFAKSIDLAASAFSPSLTSFVTICTGWEKIAMVSKHVVLLWQICLIFFRNLRLVHYMKKYCILKTYESKLNITQGCKSSVVFD